MQPATDNDPLWFTRLTVNASVMTTDAADAADGADARTSFRSRQCAERQSAAPGSATAICVSDAVAPFVSPRGDNCGNIEFMDQATLIEVLRSYDAALRENGATGLFIFGSRALGTERPDSDLDLFIDYNPSAKIPNMFRLMQLEQQISAALGIHVTITTRNALHPLMKDSIEREALRVT
jgi:predicted nucleotidyltransferase